MPARIDLHTHSNRSDGTQTPTELMREASAVLDWVALTDHDTTAGWAEARSVAEDLGLGFIPGMEISAKDGWRSVHILAYLIDPGSPGLMAELQRVRDDRSARAERIVKNISRDYELTWEDVVAQTRDGATVGRPHIADALVAKGIVSDRGDAFDGILHPRAGYYEGHYAPSPLDVVGLIKAAGGVSVVAHPTPSGRARMMSLEAYDELIDAGLGGLELDHRENTADGVAVLRKLAKKRDLIVTGSSDYHGAGKPNRLGENTTSEAMLKRILEAGTGSQPLHPAR